jgi:hypothetical protein
MVDFLKTHPFISMDDYKWKLSVPMIRLMAMDNTRVDYLSDKQIKERKSKKISGENLMTDLGVPVF